MKNAFYSEVLDKFFLSESELKAAEKEVAEKEQVKKKELAEFEAATTALEEMYRTVEEIKSDLEAAQELRDKAKESYIKKYANGRRFKSTCTKDNDGELHVSVGFLDASNDRYKNFWDEVWWKI